jgi:hypothetical protein
MKTYAPPENTEPELPTIPRTPTRFQHVEHGLHYWKDKIANQLSSPSRQPFNSWVRGTERVLDYGELAILQHNALTTKVQNQQKAKYRNRNPALDSMEIVDSTLQSEVQKNGALTVEEAWAKKAANEAKKKAIQR